MTVKTVQDLFLEELRDIYHAEKQILKALPKMAKSATNQELKQAFELHLEQTEGQVERLEQVFEQLDVPNAAGAARPWKGCSRRPARPWRTSRTRACSTSA